MTIKIKCAALFFSVLLTACGGSEPENPAPQPVTKLLAGTTAVSGTHTFAGPFANYTAYKTATGVTVTDNVGTGGTVQLANPTRIIFDDIAFAFDLDGVAGKAYRIYQAAFDRAPDPEGLGFWIEQMDKGQTLESVASGFISSAEFTAEYGAFPSNDLLISKFYENVLHRAPDKAGYDFWVNVLNMKADTVANVLAGFGESAENKAQVAATIANGNVAYVPYKPEAPLPPLTLATFAACPDSSGIQTPEFYKCMVGQINGQTVFGNGACSLKIASNGKITLATSDTVKVIQPGMGVYQKMSFGTPDNFFMGLLTGGLRLDIVSPKYSAATGGAMVSGIQVDADGISCKFAL